MVVFPQIAAFTQSVNQSFVIMQILTSSMTSLFVVQLEVLFLSRIRVILSVLVNCFFVSFGDRCCMLFTFVLIESL